MVRQRYMILEYHRDTENKLVINNAGTLENHLPIHELLISHHWSRLDDEHVVVLGTYSIGNHKHLENHTRLSILPHLASAKPLHTAVKHQNHWHSLRQAVRADDIPLTMTDIVDDLEAIHGTVFGPLR